MDKKRKYDFSSINLGEKMSKKVIETYLEKHNNKYLFVILAQMRANYLASLPKVIKENFNKKITEKALEDITSENMLMYLQDNNEDNVTNEKNN